MEKLRAQLDKMLDELEEAEEVRSRLDELISFYPFNEFEYIISHLLASEVLTLDDYHQMRDEYIERNLYLYLFEISAPRGFGERWAQGHLRELIQDLKRPSKTLDPDYSGQYDFFLQPGIRIEVKASRAVDFDSDEPLYIKALSSNAENRFDMNFQQIKPRFCDVFVWVAAWRDVIMYWILSSFEVENNQYYSRGQHRGNVGEGQLHIKHDNIRDFDSYLFKPNELERAIRSAYERQMRQ